MEGWWMGDGFMMEGWKRDKRGDLFSGGEEVAAPCLPSGCVGLRKGREEGLMLPAGTGVSAGYINPLHPQ